MNYREIYNSKVEQFKIQTVSQMLIDRGCVYDTVNNKYDIGSVIKFSTDCIVLSVDFTKDHIRIRSDYTDRTGTNRPVDEFIIDEISYEKSPDDIIRIIDDIFMQRIEDCKYFK
ncbi:MAG: hypothetical protein PVI88_00025 [Nitrosopumilaceae archaeon]|jgi:hypothetical protein